MFDHIMAGVEIISGKIGHFAIYVSLVFIIYFSYKHFCESNSFRLCFKLRLPEVSG